MFAKFAFAAALLLAPAAAVAQAPEPPKGLDVMAMHAGTWDADITFPSQDPAKPDGKAKGVIKTTLRSNGTVVLDEFSVDGTPYQGTGMWGYDRATGRYTGVWQDNNDQHMRIDDGMWNAAKKTMTWSSDTVTAGGGHMVTVMTTTFESDTVRTFENVALTRKGQVPLVRIRFTKRPG